MVTEVKTETKQRKNRNVQIKRRKKVVTQVAIKAAKASVGQIRGH